MAHSELEQAAALATALGLGGVIKGLVDAALARWGPKKTPRPARRPSLLAEARQRAAIAEAEAELKRHEATRLLIDDYKDQLGFVRSHCEALEARCADLEQGLADCHRAHADCERKTEALRAELDGVIAAQQPLTY